MAAILPQGNRSTELVVVRELRRRKLLGWRRHWRVMGRPDFAWPKRKIALFVDGCFWHGCACRRAPKSNIKFWDEKVRRNKRRDFRVGRILRGRGWKILRIRECRLKFSLPFSRLEKTLNAPKVVGSH
jgi:DNA mismatch endonuclease (patch repair protein)